MTGKNINFSENEMWKILDAIKTYQNDYAVTGAVSKTLSNIVNKLNKALNCTS